MDMGSDKQRAAKRLVAALAVVGALLVPATALASAGPVPPPAVPGVAPLPGPIAAASTPAATVGVLKTTPDVGNAGRQMTISGTGLKANADVQLVWMTASVRWILDARTDSVDYIGRNVEKFGVVLTGARTDASGAFRVALKAPRDFGGIHDIYAVIDGKQVAKGGFLIERRLTITPKRGPIGTPITIHATGLGSPLYDSGGAIYWDNHYTGVFTGNTTRGDATFTIRAAGPVGKHYIVSGPAITVDYLNAPQSPQPWQKLFNVAFTVTKDAGPPQPSVTRSVRVAPTVAPTTTLDAAPNAQGVTAKLSASSGGILSKVELTAVGLAAGKAVALQWGTVVGNRVNCSGTCWAITPIGLGTATADVSGGLSTTVTIPDTLGGWHMVQLLQDGQIKAQVPYFVNRTLVDVSPKKVRAGQRFTVHLKGVGWTQLDNTAAVTYDNSYVGYGCGFNSNGDVVLNLVATGAPGTHLIDLYPLLYTQNPAYKDAVYGMVPFLSFAQDAPGLALGYDLPAIRTAITVVK
jgi:hypothetical protein